MAQSISASSYNLVIRPGVLMRGSSVGSGAAWIRKTLWSIGRPVGMRKRGHLCRRRSQCSQICHTVRRMPCCLQKSSVRAQEFMSLGLGMPILLENRLDFYLTVNNTANQIEWRIAIEHSDCSVFSSFTAGQFVSTIRKRRYISLGGGVGELGKVRLARHESLDGEAKPCSSGQPSSL